MALGLNRSEPPDIDLARSALVPMCELAHVFAEGPGGMLAGAVLRSLGFRGRLTLIPYLNPHRFEHLAAARWYASFAAPGDSVWLGSPRSAALWRTLGVPARVGEPYGIDGTRFRLRPGANAVRARLGLPPQGQLLMYAGRIEADKDVGRLLRVALKARLLVPDLGVALATHRVTAADADCLRQTLGPEAGIHLILDPAAKDLADLYCSADVFVTAATSSLETFGRAAAEALACGTPVVAPDYDGFAHVLDQPGGHLVPLTWHGDDPTLPEDRLLRAVYEVLSAPLPPDRAAIAAAATRFDRAHTLKQLAAVFEAEIRPPAPLPEAPFRIPPDHAEALRTLPPIPEASALSGPLPDPASLIRAVRRALGAAGCR
jgi:glycosyltransferase involved in cell wall biosynthesis